MNIISSNCIVGRIHEILNISYTTPFIWNSIKLSDFCKLIENFDKLDLTNISCSFDSFLGKQRATIILDNLIPIYFTHHLLNNNYVVPTKDNDGNILYNNILTYIKEKWLKRLTYINMNEYPIFIYDDIESYSDIDILNFIQLNTNYKCLLITLNKLLKLYENEKLLIYIKPENNYHTLKLAKELLQNEKIKYFLEI